MNEQQHYDNYEDEIDLKDLFMVLWKSKKVIIAITLVFAILTALITKFVIDPVYEAKIDLVVNMPLTVNTKYGDYTMMMTTNDQYIDLIRSNNVIQQTMQDLSLDLGKNSIENFSERISITKDEKKPNSFTIKVTANSPKDALTAANALYKNYIIFLDTSVKLKCSEYFINYYTTELSKNQISIDTNSKLLKKNHDLLLQIPQTINQKDALEKINAGSVDYVVLENIINENYKKVELDIITIEQTISTLQNNIETYEQYLTELNQIKENVKTNSLETNFCEVVETSVFLPSQPVAPSHKVSPSTALNTVIGALIGGMISVIYVLIKKYWFTEVK